MPESQTVNIPEGAWDTHIHVFEPERFAYGLPRSYTPKGAALKEYPFSFTKATNILVVQATVQGHGPEPLLAVLDDNEKPAPCTGVRGLTTLDPITSSDAELDALHAAGVRGVRLHEVKWGHGDDNGVGAIAGKIKVLADRIARLGWVVDVFTDIHTWAALDHLIRNELDSRVKLVADHLGKATPGDEKLNEFQVFLKLIKDGYIYAKLSGFERLYHGHEAGIDSLEPSAKAIIEAGPERILYGSDWPHTQLGVSRKGKTDEQRLNEVEGFRDVDDVLHIKKLRAWIQDEQTWINLWRENPKRLFQ
ncbi:putative Amidohydrolase-related domain-containing protein [Seiridium cardinale]